MGDQKEKNRKRQKLIKGKPNKVESAFVSKPSKPEKKGKMMKKKGKGGKRRDDDRRKRSVGGPRLPNVLRKELGMMDPKSDSGSDSEGEDDVRDLYEVEEELAEEESGKNRRFDEVDNYDYELPEDFKVG